MEGSQGTAKAQLSYLIVNDTLPPAIMTISNNETEVTGDVVPLAFKPPLGNTIRVVQVVATDPAGYSVGQLSWGYIQPGGTTVAIELDEGIPDGTNVTITAT